MEFLSVCVYVLGLVVVVVSGQENDDVPRIPKCCPLGQSIIPQLGCVEKNLTFVPEFKDTEPKIVDLVIGDRCKYGKYRLEPSKDSMDEFYLLPTGYLKLPFHEESELSPDEYCLESFEEPDGTTKVLPLLCFPPPPPDRYWNDFGIKLFRIGCLISIPFLIITMAIYLLIEELRTIHGKILICYSSCLAIAYASLSYVQFEGDTLAQNACISIAFLIQFFFVSSFFWLNVMCFHTWRAMTRSEVFAKKSTSCKRTFFWYSVYGWGCPFVILAISLIMDLTPTIPTSYIIKPNVGLETCWFKDDTAKLSYFYGPISVLLVANVVFFLLTIWYMHVNYKKGPLNNMRDVAIQIMINKRKQIFIESVLLFCAMGLNWVLEVISWLVTSSQYQDTVPQLWIFIDTFNTLHGIIVFLVFVVRDSKVRKLALEKFCFRSQYRSVERHDPQNSNFV
ncbi:unnamed protein product [Nezara viridula]|uniref:G-protein coupled receptors family 2 profile 2 domain-containing protein n=1 Tax=Nezara viridula TaxID=85310 RepID=A0A9P0HAE6_NEZVI|nr:unnamed protein product [Nezara viridula]